MSIEAMKLALTKMEYMLANGEWYEPEKAITALRQAIEQAEKHDDLTAAYMSGVYDGKRVKREWVGLTDEEARQFYEKYTNREELIYAIDKFLEEKNS